MRPTEELVTEHNAIKRMLRVLEQVAQRLEAGAQVDVSDLEQMVDFIRGFADRCHHGKEEDLLFCAMEEAGISRQEGPIGMMLHEHAVGRNYVQGMAEGIASYKAGDAAAATRIAENARGYAALLTRHIFKEDNILYPIADRVLSPETQAELMEGFEQIERERVGPGKHEEYHALLDRLEATYLG
jgi:hemerythrin-like domain-containing protein